MSSMRTISVPLCPECKAPGSILYQNLHDTLFNVPGTWTYKKCTNINCGILWPDPHPHTEDISKAYETYYTHSETSSKSFIQSVLALGQKILVQGVLFFTGLFWEKKKMDLLFLGELPPGHLLEVGCGDGLFLKRMQDHHWKVEGCDFDPRLAQEAERKYQISVRIGTLESLNYPSNCFDALVMNHVFEHVYDSHTLLKEIFRILKPGGRIVIVTPNAQSWGHAFFKESWRGLEPPRHLKIFTPRALESVVHNSGFIINSIKTTAVNAWLILSASAEVQRNQFLKTTYKKPNVIQILKALGLQIIESLLNCFGNNRGEECVLIAQKPIDP